jgi:hypothetical protein
MVLILILYAFELSRGDWATIRRQTPPILSARSADHVPAEFMCVDSVGICLSRVIRVSPKATRAQDIDRSSETIRYPSQM